MGYAKGGATEDGKVGGLFACEDFVECGEVVVAKGEGAGRVHAKEGIGFGNYASLGEKCGGFGVVGDGYGCGKVVGWGHVGAVDGLEGVGFAEDGLEFDEGFVEFGGKL